VAEAQRVRRQLTIAPEVRVTATDDYGDAIGLVLGSDAGGVSASSVLPPEGFRTISSLGRSVVVTYQGMSRGHRCVVRVMDGSAPELAWDPRSSRSAADGLVVVDCAMP
jgi:hypothetical protein